MKMPYNIHKHNIVGNIRDQVYTLFLPSLFRLLDQPNPVLWCVTTDPLISETVAGHWPPPRNLLEGAKKSV